MADTPSSWQDRVLDELADNNGRTQLATEGMVMAVWAVKSNTDEHGFYYVIDLGWIVLCTCKSFRFRTDCTHAREYTDGKMAEGVDTPALRSVD